MPVAGVEESRIKRMTNSFLGCKTLNDYFLCEGSYSDVIAFLHGSGAAMATFRTSWKLGWGSSNYNASCERLEWLVSVIDDEL